MPQVQRSYIDLAADAWREDRAAGLPMYRCGNCSVEFGVELTVAGPQCCPGCGVIFEPKQQLTTEEQAAQLARCARALDMNPSTLLYYLRTATLLARFFR
jgi:hypothetical protein